MTQRICPRCRLVVRIEDENILVYCSNCGLPQVRLSGELQEQLEEQAAAEASPATTARPLPDRPDPAAVAWDSVIRYALVVSVCMSFFVLLLPPMALFTAPIAVWLYAARHRESRITARVGVRIGLLCGLCTGFGIAAMQTVMFLALRFGAHSSDLDDRLNTLFAQMRDRVLAQSGAATADLVTPFITIPEFRAGVFLSGIAMYCAGLLLLGVIGGAFAGYWRSRPRIPA